MSLQDTQSIDVRALEIERTADGSATLIHRESGLTYRSTFGAHTESTYVFVEGTRVFESPGPRRVLEFGLGAGTSFLATLSRYRTMGIQAPLVYHAIEQAPIAPLLARRLHAATALPDDLACLEQALGKSQNATTPAICVEHPTLPVCLTVWVGHFQNAVLPSKFFNAVYHDPFGPKVNPDGWSVPWFRQARQAMQDGAILTTYSAASSVRQAMAQAGLYLGARPGSGGKREMTGAATLPASLLGFKLLRAAKQPKGDE